LITTNLVVAEVHRLLLFRAGVAAAAHALNRLEESPALTIEFPTGEHHRAAREWLARLSNHPITYADAVSFAVMTTSRCDAALTFDSDFERAGFPLWRG
jgi:predicted nucleic acid-binding protein